MIEKIWHWNCVWKNSVYLKKKTIPRFDLKIWKLKICSLAAWWFWWFWRKLPLAFWFWNRKFGWKMDFTMRSTKRQWMSAKNPTTFAISWKNGRWIWPVVERGIRTLLRIWSPFVIWIAIRMGKMRWKYVFASKLKILSQIISLQSSDLGKFQFIIWCRV